MRPLVVVDSVDLAKAVAKLPGLVDSVDLAKAVAKVPGLVGSVDLAKVAARLLDLVALGVQQTLLVPPNPLEWAVANPR